MKVAKYKRIIVRLYLPLLLVSLLAGAAFMSAWKAGQEQQSVQVLQEQLAMLEFSLIQMHEARYRAQNTENQPQLELGTHILDRIIETMPPAHHHRHLTIKEKILKLQQRWQQYAILYRNTGAKEASEGLPLMFRRILEEIKELQANNSQRGLQLETILLLSFGSAGLLLLALLFCIIRFVWREIWLPLRSLHAQADALLAGKELPQFPFHSSLFQQLFIKLGQHQQQLLQLTRMAEQIGEGDFSQKATDLELAGVFGSSIGSMREKIRLSFLEEEKRRWSNEGIARFSVMLRENNQGQEELCARLLAELIPFVGASQGGLFIKEEQEETVLELKACYAWNRRKHHKKRYFLGEGLIGQAALDKDMILLTEVPDDFLSIGSGLGHAKPRVVVLLPLISGEQLYGVLELASFHHFGDHQLSFLQKLCEILAAAIGMSSGSQMTARLLRETEEANMQLKAQEEELRQNTEELMATQEAMRRKEMELEVKLQQAMQEMESQISEIQSEKAKNEAILEGCVDGVISFNQQGIIEYFNKAAEELWEMPRQQVLGRSIGDFIPLEVREQDGEPFVFCTKNGMQTVLDTRTELPISGRAGLEMEVLLTLARAKVAGAYTFTAFAQRVAVELF